MDEKKKGGYIAGIGGIIIAIVFIASAFSNGLTLDTNKIIMAALGLVFLILGFGSILKPDTIGDILATMFKNAAKNSGQNVSANQSGKGNNQNTAGRDINQTFNFTPNSETDDEKKKKQRPPQL